MGGIQVLNRINAPRNVYTVQESVHNDGRAGSCAIDHTIDNIDNHAGSDIVHARRLYAHADT